ncbi:endospore germination permease [Bacillus sp. H-16]|uniref:GerAB/ArcD/ProY family transporter n=1 Tax=Alteribacter salitolerans TaxID=2912333 RepID=UPI00196663D9|nr:endospore germination permease [Alteribacter salitolerans]MBM7096046.1 endospore germination permease [Alteribacter salitolerans]
MKHTINRWQFALLVANFIVGSSLLMAPSAAAMFAEQDAWISMGGAGLIGIGINTVLFLLLKKYNYTSIFHIIELVSGKWIGTIVNLVLIFAGAHLAALVMRNFSNFVNIVALPETSIHVVIFMALILVVYSVSKGVQNIGRVNEVVLPVMIFVVLGTLLVVLNKFHWDFLLPVLDKGWLPVMEGIHPLVGFPFVEMMLFSALATYVSDKKHLITYTLVAIGFSGSVLMLAIVVTLGVEGPFLAGRETYATYSMARSIEIGELFQRVEAAIGIVWLLSLIVKITVCFLAVILGLQHISRKKTYTPFILPIAILIWAMSEHLHPDIVDFTDFVLKNWTFYWLTVYGIVIAVLVSGIVMKKHRFTKENTTHLQGGAEGK